jgi:ATP/maltotriose-dependent transcriptional regulator MalT
MVDVYLMGPLMHGPMKPDEVRARLEPLRGQGLIALNTILRVEAHLLDLAGRYDDALEKYAEADAVCADLGLTALLTVMRQWSGEVLHHKGDIERAREQMLGAVADLEALGDKSFRSTALVRLARVLYSARELDEAERRAVEGEELGAAEDVVNFANGRSVRALIAADRGDLAKAESLAEDGVRYAYETDFPWVHAEAHVARAYVLRAAGRESEARRDLERALERYDAIGNVPEAERTRELLVEL